VPDRRTLGDLGAPLFKAKADTSSDSTSQRESTPRFLQRMGAAWRRDAFQES
jgi:hypothetical protein